MIVHGLIYDQSSNAPLPGASVTVLNSAGNPTGAGTTADNDGWFELMSTALDQGGKLFISAVSHESVAVDPDVFNGTGVVRLSVNPEELPAVVITPKKSDIALPLILAGGGLLLFAMPGEKKKKMGEVKIDGKILLYAGVGVGAFFLVIKPVLKSLHLWPGADIAKSNQDALNNSVNDLQNQGGSQSQASFTATQYQSMANSIYQLGYADNPSGMTDLLKQQRTLMDVLQLVKAFGTREGPASWLSACALVHYDCPQVDLAAFVHSWLSSSQLADVNAYYLSKGINYQF